MSPSSMVCALLSREMEILCNDQIYQEALKVAASLIERFA
jgi:hypothetical protein